MITYRIGLSGPGARGARVDGALLRDLLAVLTDGVTQSVRLRVEGRSTAQGKLPAWLERAESGAAIRGVVAGDAIDLPVLATLWGRPAQVSGVAKLPPSGAVLRIDAERIEPASTEDLALWSLEPVPAFGPLDERALVRTQGPCSGVSAVLGQLREVEEDDAAIIKALDEFS